MKMPQTPPDQSRLWDTIGPSRRLPAILQAVPGPSARGQYLHWDKLVRHPPPEGLSHQEWWFGLKLNRRTLARAVPLVDKLSRHFRYVLADPIPEWLHEIDQGAGGMIEIPDPITNPETKDRYYVRSLIDEAITSSQLEGAATTRQVAREMIRAGRKPRDRSEQMILNNYRTMRRIGELKEKPLTERLIFELHRLVTRDTLDDPSAVGRPRRQDEPIVVDDMYGTVFHDPPPAGELARRMRAMCDFANGRTPGEFVHPVIRSIILHFWLAYDHPFVDGNGRTARALFYWSMLHHGFWLFEFISISPIIRKGPAKYGRAFLHVETDENDLTYFILYHLHVIRRALDELHDFVRKETRRLRALEARLRGIAVLNHRQRDLIGHALRHPQHRYTIESHRVSQNVVYQTARTDFLDLVDRGLMHGEKVGRTWYFTPVADLEKRLGAMS